MDSYEKDWKPEIQMKNKNFEGELNYEKKYVPKSGVLTADQARQNPK